jgi:hypothetical protein
LHGVRVPHEALGEELLRHLPLDAQCLPSK